MLGWFLFTCKIKSRFLSLTLQNGSPVYLPHRKSSYSSSSLNPLKSPHSASCHVLSSLCLLTPLSFWTCLFLLDCFPYTLLHPPHYIFGKLTNILSNLYHLCVWSYKQSNIFLFRAFTLHFVYISTLAITNSNFISVSPIKYIRNLVKCVVYIGPQ